MHIMQSRRDFLTALSAAGAGSIVGGPGSFADEGPPETTTVRLSFSTAICTAPPYVAEAFLRAEGFTDVHYVRAAGGFSTTQQIAEGEV